MKRLDLLEQVIAERSDAAVVPVDFSVFTDEELDRLEVLAERYRAWTGNNWFHEDLSPTEQDAFMLLAEKASGRK